MTNSPKDPALDFYRNLQIAGVILFAVLLYFAKQDGQKKYEKQWSQQESLCQKYYGNNVHIHIEAVLSHNTIECEKKVWLDKEHTAYSLDLNFPKIIIDN